jgi:hypothetical protein
MSKRAIPSIPADIPARNVLEALKENVEALEGRRGGKIDLLTGAENLNGVIDKVNEILNRLQE